MGARPGQTINIVGGAFVCSSDGSIDVEGGPAQGQIDLAASGIVQGGATTVTYEALKVDCITPGPRPLMPSRPGFLFMGFRYAAYLVAATGAATGSLQFSIGNDAPNGNVVTAVTVAAATINGVVAVGLPSFLASLNTGGNPGLADGAAPILLRIITAPTGMTVCVVSFLICGVWVPI